MTYEFDCEIMKLEGKIKWAVFYFPYPASDEFGSKGNIPVLITVDGHSFEHTLLPSKNGHYLVYNDFIRKAVCKEIGEVIHVTLEKDTKERRYVVPRHIEKALSDHGVLEKFMKQPDYLKREQVNFIDSAVKAETKENRLDKLITGLMELNRYQTQDP